MYSTLSLPKKNQIFKVLLQHSPTDFYQKQEMEDKRI